MITHAVMDFIKFVIKIKGSWEKLLLYIRMKHQNVNSQMVC